ncbi:MAG: hypothetical protein GY749_37780 [Desulfobacteraceae bacterium]|nr:hypothetical protein [Desulfobacteraceae bacterium]
MIKTQGLIMKKSMLMILFASILIPYVSLASSPKDHASWWIKKYGALQADNPIVPRSHEIFDKVLAAADKRGTQYPKLVILRSAGGHMAMCLEDGTVLLTKKAINICYKGTDEITGNARVAFVMGHELAHLANGDFWYRETSQALKSFAPDSDVSKDIQKLLDGIEPVDEKREKEFRADAYGLLYASMAGYDPKAIADTKGTNFFQEWAKQTGSPDIHPSSPHPSPKARAEVLISKMKDVADKIELFDIGIRFYQLGRYEEALVFLEMFKVKFPCREVFNNIGLIHYQMGMKKLAECNPKKAFRFRLATVLDTGTRAENMRLREECEKNVFKESLRNLRNACEMDTFYVPARVNYASALIMAGKYSKAMDKIMDEALKIEENNPNALNNLAVAIFLIGPSPFIKVDMYKDASDILKSIIRKQPGFPDAYYNLGRIQAERGRNAAARQTWEKYLKLERSGMYADIVRESLEIKKDTGSELDSMPFHELPVAEIGLYKDVEKHLKGFAKSVLKPGTVYCEYYVRDKTRVLVLDDVVEIIESPVRQNMSLSDVQSKYGKSDRVFNRYSGTETHLYKRFALDIQKDMVIRVIHFEKSYQ